MNFDPLGGSFGYEIRRWGNHPFAQLGSRGAPGEAAYLRPRTKRRRGFESMIM